MLSKYAGAVMRISSNRYHSLLILQFAVICTVMLLCRPGQAVSGNHPATSGPHSLFVHNSAANDPATLNANGWVDLNNPVLNVQLFDTYGIINASHGIKLIENQRYRVALALADTSPRKSNAFFETDFLNEISESVAHIYASRKIPVSQTMLLSVDWDRLGAIYMAPTGFKTTLYYYLSDLGGDNISGFEGEVSYPVTDSVRIGIKGTADLSQRSAFDRNWKSFAFLTYAFGSQKGTR